MAKSTRSKVKRAFRAKKRTDGVFAAAEAARLHRLNAKLRALTTATHAAGGEADGSREREKAGQAQEELQDMDMLAEDADGDADEETVSPPTEDTHGENFDAWTERVASRTLEGLEGYDASSQVKGDE